MGCLVATHMSRELYGGVHAPVGDSLVVAAATDHIRMMQNMYLEEGDIVQVKSASLAKATYVKLQPHTTDFLDISNPKAILETTFRSYSCLTVGDTIMIPYNNKNYYINIVETKPSPAVSIIETDFEVDSAPPLDYKEIEKLAPLQSNKKLKVEEEPPSKIEFILFSGSPRRLDGKQAAPLLKQHHSSACIETVASKSPSSTSSQRAGKLVFGPETKQQMYVAMKNSQERSKERDNSSLHREEVFTDMMTVLLATVPPTAFATRSEVILTYDVEAEPNNQFSNIRNPLAMVFEAYNSPINCIAKGLWCWSNLNGCCKPCGCLAGFCYAKGPCN
ncbi:Ubiquitin fusion degradation protein 1-like protein [Hibiscus syriacus]|uniref:Ubiquitin fusion degradation protein 1-like protein n=1 Tax=Hibiscus syriacus TaxID=106335 RepID=A0A6A3CHL1_HIBSY|nr:Ubiquitin fusion degradation protein 1-like protein [Hibiscus syriacus]